MEENKFIRLALAGMLTGSIAVVQNCTSGSGEAKANASVEQAEGQYSEVHNCAGLNICKGLGGCTVTEEKLKDLAKKRGISLEEAGEAHDCAGHNACKGLGGCAVTEQKFQKLKAAVDSQG